jgi:hypothetical protein
MFLFQLKNIDKVNARLQNEKIGEINVAISII